MVRFGYRKVNVVAPWKVEEKGANQRGKRPVQLGGPCKEAAQKMMTWMKARLQNAEKDIPPLFSSGQPEIILRHAEQLKMTLVYEKRQS